jgi:hypothetical protein
MPESEGRQRLGNGIIGMWLDTPSSPLKGIDYFDVRSSVWNDDDGAGSNFIGMKKSRTIKFHRNNRGS